MIVKNKYTQPFSLQRRVYTTWGNDVRKTRYLPEDNASQPESNELKLLGVVRFYNERLKGIYHVGTALQTFSKFWSHVSINKV